MLAGFLRGARVTSLMDGQIDVNADPGALSRMSNGVFFTAIRTAWASYKSLSSTLASGPATTGIVALINPDAARLEEWEPQAYLVATYSMPMALDHSVIADLRQRARESGQLIQWQEEGNIVERWAKRCEAAGSSDLVRGDMGRLLSALWAEELKRQLAGKGDVLRPTGWRQSSSLTLSAATPRSNEGPIGFAFDVISAWHADLVLALQFLARIKAEVSIPTALGLPTHRNRPERVSRGTELGPILKCPIMDQRRTELGPNRWRTEPSPIQRRPIRGQTRQIDLWTAVLSRSPHPPSQARRARRLRPTLGPIMVLVGQPQRGSLAV
jgi:hypothetical protein